MTTSANIDIEHLVSNAASPEVPVNEALNLIDYCVAGQVTINIASDADLTLSTTGAAPQQWQYLSLNITDTGVLLTAGRNVIVPGNKKTYLVFNETAQTLTVKTSAGTGIAVSPSGVQYLYCNGVDVVAATSGGAALTALVQDTSPQLGGDLDANGHIISESKGSDIASASTLTIPTDGNYFSVTGTTTVTSISSVAVGTEITLRFTAVLTLTNHATDLILPTGANITTTAGDVASFREYAAGDWVCVSYQKANGESLAGTAASVLDMPVQPKSTNYTVVSGDKGNMISADASGGAVTITLLAAASAGNGYTIAIKKSDSSVNAVTIDADGSETIDGGATKTVTTQNDAVFLTCNGASWFVLAEPASGSSPTESLIIPVSDESTDLTTGTAKVTFRMPYGFTLSGVRASVTTAPTGSVLTVDINESGATILSTKLTIDAGEKTSTTAAAQAVISDSALADDAEITIDIDGIGSTIAGAGLKVVLIGVRA